MSSGGKSSCFSANQRAIARVVARGVGERLGREALARGERERARSASRELLQDRVVGLRVRRPPRRTAKFFAAARIIVGPPMSMFSITSCSVDAAAGGGRLERVEVHAHEVDELDLVLRGRGHVLRVVAQREQAGVELRVQRLDAPAHDLREAREVVDRADLEPGRLAARWAVPPVETSSTPSSASPRAKSTIPVLSETESSARRTRTSPGCGLHRRADDSSRTRSARGAGWRVEADGAAGDQPHRLGQQLVLDRAQRVADLVGVGAPSGSSTARCRMIGPVSTPSSTKWTVTPKTLTP